MNNIQYTCTFFDHLLYLFVTGCDKTCACTYVHVYIRTRTYVVEGGIYICTKSSPLRYMYTPHGNIIIIISISSPLRDFGTHSTVGCFN